VWIALLLLTGALSACAGNRASEECGASGCSGDANITANVQGLLAQHPELQGADQLYVNTIDHVVYLTGTVETGLHRDIAASVARQVSGVSNVVNNVAVDK
jgi:osmotically-inducible protein OsmY